MIAEKRARKRPLIRAATLKAALTKNLSVDPHVAGRQKGQQDLRHDDPAAFPKMYSFESHSNTPPSRFAESIPISASLKHLQQLSTLQAAGILTAEEVLAARGRLLGS